MIEPEKYLEAKSRVGFLYYLPINSICAELGVYSGKFSYWIIKKVQPQKLYLVDPYWNLYGNEYPWNKKSTWNTFVSAVKIIQKYDVQKCSTFVIDTDIEFSKLIPDNYLDWVYLDSTHLYENTLMELDAIKSKIKSKGFICGHDWRLNPKHRHYGVYKAISEWLPKNKDFRLFLLDNYSQWMLKKK